VALGKQNGAAREKLPKTQNFYQSGKKSRVIYVAKASSCVGGDWWKLERESGKKNKKATLGPGGITGREVGGPFSVKRRELKNQEKKGRTGKTRR